MEKITVSSKNAITVRAYPGKNPKQLYPHQIEAITELNIIDRREDFSTLLVLPTGAGKTRAAVSWLLTAAIDRKKKILWLAHRHLLLDQAAGSFKSNASS